MVRKPYQVYLDELLSAYLDGELSPSAREELEARLAFDSGLQGRLEELRHMVDMLRSMPQEEVPRNFLLTPAMVAPEKPERRAETSLQGLFAGRWTAPVLTFATALSAFVCVAALVVNLSLNRMGGLPAALESEPAYQVAMEDVVEGAAPPETPADMLDAQEQEEIGEAVPEDDGEAAPRAAETEAFTQSVPLPMVASEGLTVTVAPGEAMEASPPVSITVFPTSEAVVGVTPEEVAEIVDTAPAPAPGRDEWQTPSGPAPAAGTAIEQPARSGATWVLVGFLGLLTGSLVVVTVLAWRARGR